MPDKHEVDGSSPSWPMFPLGAVPLGTFEQVPRALMARSPPAFGV